jgi:DNA-binding NarL/FixJ family response regulator
MSLKLVLADDHRMMREGLRSMLENQPDIEVVGEAADGKDAVEMVRRLAPDVIVMDINMPRLDGIDATRQICADTPQTKVVVLSMHTERPFVYEIIRAGAAAYVLKDSAINELIQAIHAAVAGQIYLSPRIAGTLVDDFVHQTHKAAPAKEVALTTRELEVLQLLAQGKSTKEIAFHLRLSVKTVETHRRQIMKKLDLHSVAELTKYAIRRGLTSL